MIAVNGWSLWLAEVSLVYWFVYFQYYWFPQLRPQPFTGFCFLMGLIYACLDRVLVNLPQTAWLSALPAIVLLAIELGCLGPKRWVYLPALLNVTVFAYLFKEFVDTLSISLTILTTNMQFAASLPGTVTELLFDNVIFALLVMALGVTQAPMENLIRAMLNRPMEYLLLVFMLCLAIVFMLFEYTLQLLNWSSMYVLFMTAVSGTLMVGLSLSTYVLMQTHLQQSHAESQRQQQAFRQQYSTELSRQMEAVRKFRHDYQNMLLGLGGYLADHDYAGFRQLYIDIRSGWETSDAADLTIDDLENMPRGIVRYALYHAYLFAQRAGVNLFVRIPQPLTATVLVTRQLSQFLDQALPVIIQAVAKVEPAMVTLELTATRDATLLQVTFPVPDATKVVGHHSVQGPAFALDFAPLLRELADDVTSQVRIKLHWGQLLIVLPMR